MKTAIQQLIDVIDNEVYNYTEIYTTRELNVYARIKNECLTLLEEEKRQIEKAFHSGQYNVMGNRKDYYTKTYNNENKQDTIQ